MTPENNEPSATHSRGECPEWGAGNRTVALAQIVEALEATPFGEVKVIMDNGRAVQILATRKILVR